MRGQYVFCMAKSQSFYMFYVLNYYFYGSASYFIVMIMGFSLESTLAQTRIGRVTLSSIWGPWEADMSSLWQIPKVFVGFQFSIIISGVSASYFNEIIMLISFECILALTRIGFGRVTLPSKGPMRG